LLALSSAALDHLLAVSQLQHLQEFDDAQTHHQLEVTEPALSSQPISHLQKLLPPVLISGGLPPVSAKLVKRIQGGSFVEMAELLPETLSSLEYGTYEEPAGQKRKHPEVFNIVDWVQCFGIYIAIISHKEPNRIPDLIGYQSQLLFRHPVNVMRVNGLYMTSAFVRRRQLLPLQNGQILISQCGNLLSLITSLVVELTESFTHTKTSFSRSSTS